MVTKKEQKRCSACAWPHFRKHDGRCARCGQKPEGRVTTANGQGPRIVQICAAAVPGERRTFVNVYGLDEHSRVWQWNAKEARWEAHKVRPRERNAGDFA